MAINANNTPPGNRNKVGARKVISTGENTKKLNLEAVFTFILIDAKNNDNLQRNMTIAGLFVFLF